MRSHRTARFVAWLFVSLGVVLQAAQSLRRGGEVHAFKTQDPQLHLVVFHGPEPLACRFGKRNAQHFRR
jgi:hypothetical protein